MENNIQFIAPPRTLESGCLGISYFDTSSKNDGTTGDCYVFTGSKLVGGVGSDKETCYKKNTV